MTDTEKAVAAHATEAISNYQWRHEKLESASRHLAEHIAQRPAAEREAYDALNIVGESGKLPTQTWLNANLDLYPGFKVWRDQRNQYEADLLLEQGKTRAAELQAMLAVALVSK